MPAYVPPALRAKLKAEAESKAKKASDNAASSAPAASHPIQPSTTPAAATLVAAEDQPLPAALVLREPSGPPPGAPIAGFSHSTPTRTAWQQQALTEAEHKRTQQKSRIAQALAKSVEEIEREARYPADDDFYTDEKSGRKIYTSQYLAKHFFGRQSTEGTVSFFRNETEEGEVSPWSYFERPLGGGLAGIEGESWDEVRAALVSSRRVRWDRQSKRAEKYWQKGKGKEQTPSEAAKEGPQSEFATPQDEGKDAPKDEELLPPREEASLRSAWERRREQRQKAQDEGKPSLVSRITVFQLLNNPLFKHPDVGVVHEAVSGGGKEQGGEDELSVLLKALPPLEGATDGEVWFRTNVEPILPPLIRHELEKERQRREDAQKRADEERAKARAEGRERAGVDGGEAGAEELGDALEDLEVSTTEPPSEVHDPSPPSPSARTQEVNPIFTTIIKPSTSTPNLGRPIPLFAPMASLNPSARPNPRRENRFGGVQGRSESLAWLGWYEMAEMKLVEPGGEEFGTMMELRDSVEVLGTVGGRGATREEVEKARSKARSKGKEKRKVDPREVWIRVALRRIAGGDKAEEVQASELKGLEEFKDRADEMERYVVEIANRERE